MRRSGWGLAGVAFMVVAFAALPVTVASPLASGESVEKARHVTPTRAIPQRIDAARARRHPPLRAAAALPKLARARLAALPSGAPPVLLPEVPELLAAAQVVTGPRWYTAFMAADTYSVYVAAVSAAVDAPTLDVPPAARAREWEPRISRSHDIVTVGFAAFGAAYDVDIECLGGVEHPMCGDDHMALDLVRALRRLER
jgi:hypothetical protein